MDVPFRPDYSDVQRIQGRVAVTESRPEVVADKEHFGAFVFRDRVYLSQAHGLACWDLNGSLLWRREFPTHSELGLPQAQGKIVLTPGCPVDSERWLWFTKPGPHYPVLWEADCCSWKAYHGASLQKLPDAVEWVDGKLVFLITELETGWQDSLAREQLRIFNLNDGQLEVPLDPALAGQIRSVTARYPNQTNETGIHGEFLNALAIGSTRRWNEQSIHLTSSSHPSSDSKEPTPVGSQDLALASFRLAAYPQLDDELMQSDVLFLGMLRSGQALACCLNPRQILLRYWEAPSLTVLVCPGCGKPVKSGEDSCQCGSPAPPNGIKPATADPPFFTIPSTYAQVMERLPHQVDSGGGLPQVVVKRVYRSRNEPKTAPGRHELNLFRLNADGSLDSLFELSCPPMKALAALPGTQTLLGWDVEQMWRVYRIEENRIEFVECIHPSRATAGEGALWSDGAHMLVRATWTAGELEVLASLESGRVTRLMKARLGPHCSNAVLDSASGRLFAGRPGGIDWYRVTPGQLDTRSQTISLGEGVFSPICLSSDRSVLWRLESRQRPWRVLLHTVRLTDPPQMDPAVDLAVSPGYNPRYIALAGSRLYAIFLDPSDGRQETVVFEVGPNGSVAHLASIKERLPWVPLGYEPASGLMVRRFWPERVVLVTSEGLTAREVASAADLVLFSIDGARLR